MLRNASAIGKSSPAIVATPSLASAFERMSFYLFLVTLAWAPFPLGSNRPWSWSLLCLLISVCWLLWYVSVWNRMDQAARLLKDLRVPMILGLLALGWAAIQILPIVPKSWTHPAWQLADEVLGRRTDAVISVNPWQTETELMKLLTYAMAVWLARVFASRSGRANLILDGMIAFGSVYAIYALILNSQGLAQYNLFYSDVAPPHDMSGPFVNHNSFATYVGIITLCASARLFELVANSVTLLKGARTLALSFITHLAGRALPFFLAAMVCLITLIATTSRAGNFSAFAAMGVLFLLGVVLAVRHSNVRWIASVSIVAFAAIAVLFVLNGDVLASRFDDLATSGMRTDTRLVLWGAAFRMIENAPLLGLGLGTYETAYPMYSDTLVPFIMDRAHNDYLELVAGWGIPAAILWWSAIAWLAVICLRGCFVRHRNRIFPMLAVGTSVLVGIHSLFDFSLQMPAISVLYAVILGMGIAQSFPTRGQA